MRLLYEPLTDIPVGFTEVEYLEGTGTQYIDTGYIPSNTTGQYARMQYTTVNNGVTFGGMISNNRVVGPYYASNTGKWYCGWGSNEPSITSATPTTSTMYDLYLNFKNDRVAKVNDIVLSDNLGTISGNYPSLTLFRRNYSAAYSYLSGKIYKYQITEGSNLVRDFIPCLDSNNVPCMYDKIEGKAYYNAGTGAFSYGRKIIPVEYLESTGTQYINTGYAPSYNTKLEMLADGINDASYPEGVSWFFGSRTANQVNGFGGYYNKNEQKLYGAFGNNQLSASLSKTLLYNKKVLVVLDNSGLYLDNVKKITFGSASFTGTYPIFLYTVNLAGSIGYKTAFKICYCKIFNNDVLVRDYIPCKDENGVGFMFDKVTHTVYLNAGTGDFAFGKTLPKKKFRLIKESNRRVPKGFKEVEYIQSTGTQYIRSGLTMPNGFRIKGSISIDDLSAAGGVFGCYTNASPYYRNFFDYTSAKNWLVGYGGGSYQYFGSNVINTVYNFDICNVHGKEHLEVNGTGYAFSPTGNTGNFTELEIPIFALNVSGTISNIAKMKLYCLKVYNENGVLVRDYLPCLDRNNVPCLFDLVEQKAYYNAGSGNFSYGHTITPVEYLESSGTQYIDTGLKGNLNTKAEILYRYPSASSVSGSGRVMGSRTNSMTNGFAIGTYSGSIITNESVGVYFSNANVGDATVTKVAINTWYQTILSTNGVYFNGTKEVLVYGSVTTFTTPNNLKLFGFDNNGTMGCGIVQISKCKIYDNGVLVRDFIPCKDENGVGYMFNNVNHTLYANAGSGAFIVGDEVKKEKTRFLMESDRRVPVGFTEVEYIESSGTQYIDTGIEPKVGKTAVDFMFSLNQLYTSAVGIFGSRTGTDPTTGTAYNIFSGTTEGTNRIRNDWSYGCSTRPYSSNNYALTNTITANTKIRVQLNADSSAQIDDGSFSTSSVTKIDCGYNMLLGSINTAGTAFANKPSAKWYYCKIWDNGVLVRDFIPCLDRNNTPCMYDLVENKAYYNAGTGTFSYGHAIIPVKYLQSSGTQYINTKINVSNTLRCDLDASFETPTGSTGYLNGATRVEGSSQQRFMMGVNSANYYSMSFIENNTTTILNDNKRHIFEIDALNKTYSIDGVQRGTFPSSFTLTTLPLYLFSRNVNSSSIDSPVYGKIYGCKMYSNNSIICDFIPVKDENNVGYLLDLVTHSLYSNAGSGSFIVG